ncbi:MAG: putative lipid II flippase FtsW [Candidatus Dependentiae bacterium]
MKVNSSYAKNDLLPYLILFCFLIGLLIVIGLVFIYSASSVYALEKFGKGYYFAQKQAVGLLIGIIAVATINIIPLLLIKRLTPLFFMLSLGLTFLTAVPGLSIRIHGSSRWLKLFFITFQPSELLKISLILYIAYLITKKSHVVSPFWQRFIPIITILGLTSFALLKQPDFGLTVTLLATTMVVFFIAQFQMRYLLWSLIAAIPALLVLIFTSPYRIRRILTFLNPWADPQGNGFQIIQSLIAIGSGNTWGMGIAHSKQKYFYLPMQHTDFIFSIIAEETGFVGCFIIISLFMSILYIGIKIALAMKDLFCSYAILGFIIMLNLQALINIAVATGLAPTKGIGLPFVSYGNTSLVGYLIIIGLILNMARNNKTYSFA